MTGGLYVFVAWTMTVMLLVALWQYTRRDW